LSSATHYPARVPAKYNATSYASKHKGYQSQRKKSTEYSHSSL
jgi:hypothetical protein